LYGLGGVGKTQTALAYAHEKRHNYHSIFWISGVNQATLFSGFEQIASKTKCAVGASSPTEITERVLVWLQQQKNWLLIVNNLDDVLIIDGVLPPIHCQGHTVITTRNPNTDGIPAQGIEVDVLNIDAGVDLFCIHLKMHPTSNAEDISEIRNIVTELGCLPLALEQSAAFIRETKRDINQFLPLYHKNRSTRQRIQNWKPEGNRKYPYSVSTTWQMSFHLIQNNSESPAAASLL
jgi:hypothetical protein